MATINIILLVLACLIVWASLGVSFGVLFAYLVSKFENDSAEIDGQTYVFFAGFGGLIPIITIGYCFVMIFYGFIKKSNFKKKFWDKVFVKFN